MDFIVFIVDHGFFVAVVGVVRNFRIGDGRIFDIDVHAEVIVVDDGEVLRPARGQPRLFDVPALGAQVEDEFLLSRYDLAVQAAVFEIAVIGNGGRAVEVYFVNQVLHFAVLFALFDHEELALADGRDIADFGSAGVLIAVSTG